MAVFMLQFARGCSSKLGNLQLDAAIKTLNALQYHLRPGDINNTKARRARELRPRRNFLLNEDVEKHRVSPLLEKPLIPETTPEQQNVEMPRHFRHVMPEFLPNPKYRDRVKEILERKDMYRRRSAIDIPEFYVGSIMSVTMADKNAPGKQSRFVGICISRAGEGLRANFILRNVIDGQGIEILFDLYNTTLQKIEVLKLEKRLDEQLFYLRDAPLEYSTVPFDFDPVPLPRGATVPVNPLKVKLNPRPWHERWERMELKGAEILNLHERFYKRAKQLAKPWEKYDLMKQYRATINDDEAETVMKEVFAETSNISKVKGRSKVSLRKEK